MVDGANATAVLVVSVVFSVLMTIALFLRFLARHWQGDFWALDDFAFAIAFVLTWACAGSDCIIAGYRPRSEESSEEDDRGYEDVLDRYFVASQICWVFAAATSKAALLLFYRRISPLPWARVAIYILIGLLGAFWVTGITFYATTRGFVLSGNAGIGAINCLLGVATMAVPLVTIWTSPDMSIRSKTSKTFWYGIGWLAVAVGIARLASWDTSDTHLYEQKSWSLLLCWSIVEPCLWLVAGSVPTIRQLLRHRQRGTDRRYAGTRIDSTSHRSFVAVPGTIADGFDLTALPPVPGATPQNVIRGHLREPSDHRPSDARLSGPFQEPTFGPPADVENQDGDTAGTPRVTRASSMRTDAGMYTHWRPEEEDDGHDLTTYPRPAHTN